ncbi:hypothetical protein [Mastigocoleus sp. MO_188.B34]|uniref:hypothetical protein n=1 Tax=Mastigocoleus sp. MO_188.B34 TaxID=3036635 RepID=UPI0026343385|nr:hypothetical protein [Mastigocoleus sp. MO_188.B34]MDJ0694406.1 hypothetical protein [Mastigocoleus sp. MO_188.B34]
MRINSTVLLTLILLSMMLGAGSVSAFWGFTIGSSALKGVSPPDGRPNSKLPSPKTGYPQDGGVNFLKEEEILKIVKARVQGKAKTTKARKLLDEEDIENNKEAETQNTEQTTPEKPQKGFPIATESEGVTLSVLSSRYSGGDLILKVRMQNKGDDSVRFLYSFLDVTDDRGRTLSASTQGLPSELTANGPTHDGTINIPTPLLDNVKKISLALTDYPAQKLRLEVSNIPVEK